MYQPRETYLIRLLCMGAIIAVSWAVWAKEPDEYVDIWPGLAPGESTAQTGEALPRREEEAPPATRITGITRPRLAIFRAKRGTSPHPAVLIFPGGGYNYVVADKEGSEAATWLNGVGVTAIVVHYRTKTDRAQPDPWRRPLQDGQRAMSLIRAQAASWNLDRSRIGVLGFSAGGNVAALISTQWENRTYKVTDAFDGESCRPDFSLLVYPAWLVSEDGVSLVDSVSVSGKTPPAFLVHTHDDGITSLSSVAYYAALKRQQIPAELHIFSQGGHGYGLRPVKDSSVSSWPVHAEAWLASQGIIEVSPVDGSTGVAR